MTPEERQRRIREIADRLAERLAERWPEEDAHVNALEDFAERIGRDLQGELSERVGESPTLLRAWERRYGLLRPLRSAGGFRLYGPEDERRVRAMQELLGAGVSARQAAEAVLSTPVPFRAFTNDPPNLLPSTFPYVWLPSFLVQAALFGHLVVFRAISRQHAR